MIRREIGICNMSDDLEQAKKPVDDSLDYEKVQGGLHTDDPLAAIKALRLEQLTVCHLKTAQDMQNMRDKAQSNKGDQAD